MEGCLLCKMFRLENFCHVLQVVATGCTSTHPSRETELIPFSESPQRPIAKAHSCRECKCRDQKFPQPDRSRVSECSDLALRWLVIHLSTESTSAPHQLKRRVRIRCQQTTDFGSHDLQQLPRPGHWRAGCCRLNFKCGRRW